MANTFFIIHGSFGNPFENWFPNLYSILSEDNNQCYVPDFPSPVGQTFKNWSKILNSYLDINILTKDSIFICHSSSCPFILKYARQHKYKFKCLITVSGFNNFFSGSADFDKINSEFYQSDDELIESASLFETIHSFYSDNDPYIDINTLEDFSNKINANKILISKGGHFNTGAGYNDFPQLNELCSTIK